MPIERYAYEADIERQQELESDDRLQGSEQSILETFEDHDAEMEV